MSVGMISGYITAALTVIFCVCWAIFGLETTGLATLIIVMVLTGIIGVWATIVGGIVVYKDYKGQ
jgi:hypothetical protein